MTELTPPEGPVLRRWAPAGEALPVVFDSPHSGQLFPADFRPAQPESMIRLAADTFVDELFAGAPEHGATLIAAEFSRVYIDPNRDESDVDLKLVEDGWTGPHEPSHKQRFGKALIWRNLGMDMPMYDRPLTAAEVRHRIEHYWRPYHDAVAEALDSAHAASGAVWHLNCHSMASYAGSSHPDAGKRRPDMTVSDREGASAGAEFVACVVESLGAMGYEVKLNDPYKGMALIERYSDPAANRHSLQIEVRRGLYLDERDRRKSDGFEALKADLDRLCAQVADFARARLGS